MEGASGRPSVPKLLCRDKHTPNLFYLSNDNDGDNDTNSMGFTVKNSSITCLKTDRSMTWRKTSSGDRGACEDKVTSIYTVVAQPFIRCSKLC